jgi:hypothetical protein
MNPSLFPYGRETSKDLHTIAVRDPGHSFGLPNPEYPWRVAQHVPESPTEGDGGATA